MNAKKLVFRLLIGAALVGMLVTPTASAAARDAGWLEQAIILVADVASDGGDIAFDAAEAVCDAATSSCPIA